MNIGRTSNSNLSTRKKYSLSSQIECVYVCVSVCGKCMWQWRSEEGFQSTGAGVIDSCELLDVIGIEPASSIQKQWPCRLLSTSYLTDQFLPIFTGFISSGHVYMYFLGVLKRYMLLSDLSRNSSKTGNQGAFPLATHPSLFGIWKYTSIPRRVQPVGEVHDTNCTNGWDFRTENVCWDLLAFSEGWRTSAWTVEVHSKLSTHSTGTLWTPFPQMPCRVVGLQGTLIHYWHTGIAHES